MIYGYARVSTKKQQRNGNSLEDQVRILTENGCTQILSDAYTGTKMDRPEFSRLLSLVKPGDTIMVTKLDRFARTANEGAQQVQDLVTSGVNVHVLNMGKADNTPMGKLMVQILFAFAEFERDMIYERTQTGRANKRENDPNYEEGRKPVSLDCDILKRCRTGEISVSKCAELLGVCKKTIYNRISG